MLVRGFRIIRKHYRPALVEWGGILNYFFSISNEVISGDGEMPDFLISSSSWMTIVPKFSIDNPSITQVSFLTGIV